MLIDIEKIIENVKQDPRTAYLKELGNAIKNVSSTIGYSNSNGGHFYSNEDLERRIEYVQELHKSAMEVINTLNKD